MPPRQTARYLMRRFEEAGVRPEQRHGQNFLIDLNLVEFLVRHAQIQPDEVVLEVGTGTGSLTALLAQAAAAVVSVEIDPRMHAMAAPQLAACGNVTLLLQDALANKNRLDDAVLTTIAERITETGARGFKLAANLPYNVATPILSNLLAGPQLPISMTATIQKEVADRIVAGPGSKDYGSLSIWMQALADVEMLRVLPPTVFWPRPQVDSAILQIRPNATKRAGVGDVGFFHQFVRGVFLHRRKHLRGVLASLLKPWLDKPAIDELLTAREIALDARAEQLDVPAMIALAKVAHLRLQAAGFSPGETLR